jgi:hypothetical protein
MVGTTGSSRLVLRVSRWAVKVPRPYSWRTFLNGLLGNMTERELGRAGLDGFCPVVFGLPGGWLNVMPYARPMTRAEFERFDYEAFVNREHYGIPAEPKPDSFGWLRGSPVAIDYGDR